jgi:hypothetical protein
MVILFTGICINMQVGISALVSVLAVSGTVCLIPQTLQTVVSPALKLEHWPFLWLQINLMKNLSSTFGSNSISKAAVPNQSHV